MITHSVYHADRLGSYIIKIKIHSSCEIEDFVETHAAIYDDSIAPNGKAALFTRGCAMSPTYGESKEKAGGLGKAQEVH